MPSRTKKPRPHDAEQIIHENAILTAIFGTFDNPKTPEESKAAIADAPFDTLIGLFSVLCSRVNMMKASVAEVQTALIGRMRSGEVSSRYGKPNAIIGMANANGDLIGEIEFAHTSKDVISSKKAGVRDKVVAELQKLGISDYTRTSIELINNKLLEAKKAGTLPPTIDALVSVSVETTDSVDFTPFGE